MKKTYLVTVKNKQYCGVDAGGVQFANGKAVVEESRILDWFKDTDGYTVTEIEEEEDGKLKEDEDAKKDGETNADDSGTSKKAATGKK